MRIEGKELRRTALIRRLRTIFAANEKKFALRMRRSINATRDRRLNPAKVRSDKHLARAIACDCRFQVPHLFQI